LPCSIHPAHSSPATQNVEFPPSVDTWRQQTRLHGVLALEVDGTAALFWGKAGPSSCLVVVTKAIPVFIELKWWRA
jgi:hypothetical protein